MLDKKSLVFLAKFFAIFGFFQWLLLEVDIIFLQEALAKTQASLLGLERSGTLLFINGQAYSITPSCTGLVSAIVLGAIIFSLKKPELPKKITVFFAGAAVLFLVNIARVYFVLLAGKMSNVQVAETLHVISWFVMSGAIIIAWYYFTKKTMGIKSFDGFL